MRLDLSDDAKADLATIARYSLRTFGKATAREYSDGLVGAMRLIQQRPNLGRPIPKMPERFLKVTYRSHHIYYRVMDDAVFIVRVLHQARDAPRHLVF